MRAGTRLLAVLTLLAVTLLAVTACGAPGDGTVRPLTEAELPARLVSPSAPQAAPSPEPRAALTGPRLHFVEGGQDGGQRLVPVTVEQVRGDAEQVADALLDRLSAGPGDELRAQGLVSALGPAAEVRLEGIEDGTALVDLSGLPEDLAADRIPLAVGQVVLTATSVPGVEQVLLRRDGEALEVPLPGGARTSAPVAQQHYASLLAERPVTPGQLPQPPPAASGPS